MSCPLVITDFYLFYLFFKDIYLFTCLSPSRCLQAQPPSRGTGHGPGRSSEVRLPCAVPSHRGLAKVPALSQQVWAGLSLLLGMLLSRVLDSWTLCP